MSISTVQQQALTILSTLLAAEQNIDRLSPTDQIAQADQLQPMGQQLTELLKKVQATYLRTAGAIEGISEEDLDELASKLQRSSEILETIEDVEMIAVTLVSIQSEAEEINPIDCTVQQVSALQAQVTQLQHDHPFLNPGARSAINTLNQCFRALQTMAAGAGAVQELQRAVIANNQPDLVEIWSKLNTDQKEKIRLELTKILGREVSKTLLRLPINEWPGSWQQKREAVEKVS